MCSSDLTGFTDDYAPANWSVTQSNSVGDVDTASAPTSIAINSGTSGEEVGCLDYTATGYLDYTIMVTTSGNISFNWSFTNLGEVPYVLINGVETPLTGFIEIGNFNQAGTMTIAVTAGQTLTFRATANNYLLISDYLEYCSTTGPTLTLTNFKVTQNTAVASTVWSASDEGTMVGSNR